MMISMELLAAPARRLWSRCIQHRSSFRDFAASFQLFYHRRIFSSTFLLICNKNPLYHHDFQCLKISVRWSITLLRKPCCRSKPPPGAWLSEGTRIPGPLIKKLTLMDFCANICFKACVLTIVLCNFALYQLLMYFRVIAFLSHYFAEL